MSTHNLHLQYRTLKRYATIISTVPPDVALIVTLRGSNYRCLEQISMVPKGFEPLKFELSVKGRNQASHKEDYCSFDITPRRVVLHYENTPVQIY